MTRSTTVGIVGRPCRADVTPWGDVTAWGSPDAPDGTLRWFVAAEDRWHDPSREPAVRQVRVAGTPVVETRLRVPDGDAVQHVWSAPDRGGLTFVEVTNDSPLSFAVAFSGPPVLTDRPPASTPVQGIDLPPDAFVMPVGHHTTVRVALPHEPARWAGRALDESRADRGAVVSGWTATCERASRLELPDERLVRRIIEARCDLLLSGPVAADDDPAGFVLDVGELVRLGEPAGRWLPEIVAPSEAIARWGGEEALADDALVAAERVAIAAGDGVAARDLARIRGGRPSPNPTATPSSQNVPGEIVGGEIVGGEIVGGEIVGGEIVGGEIVGGEIVGGESVGRFVRDVERQVARPTRRGCDLLPGGFPATWLGHGLEAHRVPTGPRSAISFAVRWHGEHPAVLWEQVGDPLALTASSVATGWSTADPSGEALWYTPPESGAATS